MLTFCPTDHLHTRVLLRIVRVLKVSREDLRKALKHVRHTHTGITDWYAWNSKNTRMKVEHCRSGYSALLAMASEPGLQMPGSGEERRGEGRRGGSLRSEGIR
jgi:hypothetical protein